MKISAILPKPRLFEDMIREDTTYKAFNRAGRMLVERQMSEKEILDLFANIEKGVTAAGKMPGGASNRTLLGKGKDTATDAASAISKAFSAVDKKIGISSGIESFDASYDILAKKLGDKFGQDGKIMTAIKKYREFATAHPIMQGAIYAGLIALTGLSGAGLGGAAILAGIKLFDKLLLGNKLSSSLWTAFLTGATAYGISQAQQAFSGGSAPAFDPSKMPAYDDAGNLMPGFQINPETGGTYYNPDSTALSGAGPDPLAPGTPVTPQSQMNADDIANGSGVPDAPALDAETMANNAANAKAYGIDGADTTADMNKAIMQTAEPGTTPADYSQIGAAGNGTEYTVVKGDTLSQIAEKNNVSVDDMMKANPDITNPDVLKAGQEIKIPSATSNAVYDQGVGTASDTAAKVASGQYTPNPASAAPAPVPTPTLKAGPGQQVAESRRNMNNMLMEAIVATTNSIKPFKAKTIDLSAMIDRQTTAHVWMLGESLGRNYKHRYHITEAGIDNIFKNVERYQRHIQIVVTESLLNEDAPPKLPGVAAADATKTKPSVGSLLTNPVAPKPEAEVTAPKPEAEVTAPKPEAKVTAPKPEAEVTPAGAPTPKKPGLLSRMWAGAKQLGHQFTTKITAEKLRMNWGKDKPTESDEIATFLQGQGVPAKVISDVFTQSKLPVPQAITDAAAVPAPDAAAGGTATPAGGTATPAGGAAATLAGPGNPDNPAVAKAKAAMGIKPDTPAEAPAGGAAAGGTATSTGAATIPAGEKATTTTQVAEVKREMDQDIDDLVRSLRKLDNLVQPGYVEYIRNRLDQSFGKPKVAPKKRTSVKAKTVTSPPVAESAPIYTAMSKRIPQSESRLTKRAKNALDMFENFVEKTKAETKPLTESNTRPLIKRALTEQKAKQSIKITKKAVVQRNEVIDLWKKMPG